MKPTYYLPFALIVLLLLFSIISVCTSNRNDKVITQSELNSALANQKNRLKTYYLKLENKHLDSLMNVESAKIKKAEIKASKHAEIANKYFVIAKQQQRQLDSLKNISAPCSEQLSKCIETNSTLNNVIAENDTTIESLGQEAESYSRKLYLSEKQNLNLNVTVLSKDSTIFSINEINQNLTKQLKKNNSWFNRNKLWIGFGLGVIGTALILK
jgi:hypothetical protein